MYLRCAPAGNPIVSTYFGRPRAVGGRGEDPPPTKHAMLCFGARCFVMLRPRQIRRTLQQGHQASTRERRHPRHHRTPHLR